MITYRKTRQSEWVAYGPIAEFPSFPGDPRIRVTRKDGSKRTEFIDRLGTPFTVDGVQMRYAYLDKEAKAEAARDRQISDEVRRASRMYGTDMAEYGSGFCPDEMV